MERKTISIDPYIEAGGILGTRLEVNPKAADSVMKRTALRRDVVVVKGFERESRSYEGSDEIAVSKSKTAESKISTEGKHYSLQKRGDQWVVFLHDQEISDDIQNSTQKQRSNKPSSYDKRFTGFVNSALVDAISTASIKEKIQVAKASSLYSVDFVAISGFALGGTACVAGYIVEVPRVINLIPIGNSFPLVGAAEIDDIWKAGVVVFGTVACRVIATATDVFNSETDEKLLKNWEHYVPHLPILSAGLGELSLELNRGRLVRLNDSK